MYGGGALMNSGKYAGVGIFLPFVQAGKLTTREIWKPYPEGTLAALPFKDSILLHVLGS